jgi:hypothetical protein
MASCNSLILLNVNMPLQPTRSVNSLKYLYVANVAVAL